MKKSSLGDTLIDLINIRASQINGCGFCLDMHCKEAKIHGEHELRVYHVPIWRDVPMMIYLGKPGSGEQMPIELTGVFTDQGVVNEQTVGKAVGQRTVIRIDNNDRHVFELYFKPPEGKEQLAMRMVFTRNK